MPDAARLSKSKSASTKVENGKPKRNLADPRKKVLSNSVQTPGTKAPLALSLKRKKVGIVAMTGKTDPPNTGGSVSEPGSSTLSKRSGMRLSGTPEPGGLPSAATPRND